MNSSGAICRDVFRGGRLSIQVLDRDSARFCIHNEPYAVISITDPTNKHPMLAASPNQRTVLRLGFSDVDARAVRRFLPTSHITAFTLDMARQIAELVEAQLHSGVALIGER